MSAEYNATTTISWFTTPPTLASSFDDGHYSATCPRCPGWTAVADTWDELMALVGEFHESLEATHGDWTLYLPWRES